MCTGIIGETWLDAVQCQVALTTKGQLKRADLKRVKYWVDKWVQRARSASDLREVESEDDREDCLDAGAV